MSGLERRLARLQTIYAARPGCATCADWGGVVLVFLDEHGQEVERSRPDACHDCGRDALARVVREYVGIGPECV